MTKKTYDVSIVSANYNNGKYIDKLINSIEESSVLPRELIIVDDGSTDDSIKILSKYHFDYLNIVALENNVGFGNALNIGIAKASAKYILRIDPDDYFHPDRIQAQVEFLEKNPNVDVVGSNTYYFSNETGKIINRSNFPQGIHKIKYRYEKGEHGVLHGTVCAKAEIYKRYKYYQENVPAEDYDIFARMCKDGILFDNLKDNLLYCRIHQNSVSNDLPYQTIAKTYELRDRIFKKQSSKLWVYFNYLCIRNYRKYFFEKNRFLKFYYLGISSLLRPDKVIQRICR